MHCPQNLNDHVSVRVSPILAENEVSVRIQSDNNSRVFQSSVGLRTAKTHDNGSLLEGLLIGFCIEI